MGLFTMVGTYVSRRLETLFILLFFSSWLYHDGVFIKGHVPGRRISVG